MTTVLPQKSGTYTFASQPRPVQQRKKYREPTENIGGDGLYGNIMYDRRIVRGNTYAQHTLPASAQPDPIEMQRQQEIRRRNIARKRAREQLKPKSPEPLEGRKHIDVQTELYLEELSDRVEEADVDCQTDMFLDRPPTPLFIPAKTGMDVATQIYEGDLFDFDLEVKPILEVLVGKTVEQALLEVMEEEELANLRAQQRAFEELRNAEVVETQRLEEQERRHREEKERRMKQQREVLKKERETAEKIAARAFAQSYLADLVPSVFGTLSDNGYFYDPVERDVENGFMPWIMDEVEKEINKSLLGRTMLDAIIRDVVMARAAAYFKLEQSQRDAERIAQAAQALLDQQMQGDDTDKVEGVDETEVVAESRPETAPDTGAPAEGDGEEGGGEAAEDDE
ncbi:radial spoke head protein 3 homolog [Anneissia japonica]|uniref:radial spoke head protein 3 homolog n=1 Tax=Anneissia japonica TaxID=1529436 RepID=UPI001425AEED|nr:radial spoke head protein 3 homolog [Anneissia japonica]